MKLLIINSNTSENVTQIIVNNARKAAGTETQLDGITAQSGPSTIEGHLDALLAAKATAELIAHYEKAYDGFIIACGVDPGLLAAWEITKKPVVGISEAAMLTACALGYRFAILTPQQRLVDVLRSLASQYGLGTRLCGVYPVDTTVSAIAQNQEKALPAFVLAAQKAVADGANVLCLGGATLAGMDKALQQITGVPVLDGVACSVHLVESLVSMGVGVAKNGPFAYPEYKQAKSIPSHFNAFYQIEKSEH